MIEFEVIAVGPMTDGRAEGIVADYTDTATRHLAAIAMAKTHEVLNERIQHPTPYYETQVTQEKIGFAHYVNHDRDIVYGPWLEGTGSKNYPVTTFKGYHAFLAGYLQVSFTAEEELDRVLADFLPLLRGV